MSGRRGAVRPPRVELVGVSPLTKAELAERRGQGAIDLFLDERQMLMREWNEWLASDPSNDRYYDLASYVGSLRSRLYANLAALEFFRGNPRVDAVLKEGMPR